MMRRWRPFGLPAYADYLYLIDYLKGFLISHTYISILPSSSIGVFPACEAIAVIPTI
jgi:hypothetical protein